MRKAVDSVPNRKIGGIPMSRQNANCRMYPLVRSRGFSKRTGLSLDRMVP